MNPWKEKVARAGQSEPLDLPAVLNAMPATRFVSLPESAPPEPIGFCLRPGQVAGIFAPTGNGKSEFTDQLAGAVVSGGLFLGEQCRPANVGIAELEQSAASATEKYLRHGLDRPGVIISRPAVTLTPLTKQSHSRALERLAAAVHVLVVDGGEHLTSEREHDTNGDRDAMAFGRFLDSLAAQNTAILVSLQARKSLRPNAPLSIADAFGSSALLRNFETVISLRLVKPGRSELSFHKDRSGILPVGERWPLHYSAATGFTRVVEATPTPNVTTVVSAALAESPGLTYPEIADATGFKERAIRKALQSLGATALPGPRKGVKAWRLPA